MKKENSSDSNKEKYIKSLRKQKLNAKIVSYLQLAFFPFCIYLSIKYLVLYLKQRKIVKGHLMADRNKLATSLTKLGYSLNPNFWFSIYRYYELGKDIPFGYNDIKVNNEITIKLEASLTAMSKCNIFSIISIDNKIDRDAGVVSTRLYITMLDVLIEYATIHIPKSFGLMAIKLIIGYILYINGIISTF